MNDAENSLPTELIIHIYQIGVDDELQEALLLPSNPLRVGSPQTPFVYPLAQVCQLWRQIARHTPSLWSALPHFDNYPRGVIKEILHLSASNQLDIRLSCGMRSRFNTTSNIDLLNEHALRIRTLNATSHSSTIDDDFITLLEKPLPQLQKLTLRYGHGAWTIPNPTTATISSTTFLGNTASSLHTLVLKGCHIDGLSSVEFPRLYILVISSLHSPFDYSISDWLAFLKNMKSLEELHVKGSIRQDADPNLMGGEALELSSLRVFCYTGEDILYLRLLRFLQLPSLQSLKIKVEISETPMPFGVFQLQFPEVTAALRYTMFGWQEKLNNHVIYTNLGQHQISIRTFPSIDSLSADADAELEIVGKWKGECTTDTQNNVNLTFMPILTSIQDSLTGISTLITRHDEHLGTINDFRPLVVTTWALFSAMPNIRKWVMGSEVEFVRTILGVDEISWSLLDTIVLKDVDSPSDVLCDFIRERHREERPISVLYTNGTIPFGYNDDLGCRIERDDLDLDIIKWQDCQAHLNI